MLVVLIFSLYIAWIHWVTYECNKCLAIVIVIYNLKVSNALNHMENAYMQLKNIYIIVFVFSLLHFFFIPTVKISF